MGPHGNSMRKLDLSRTAAEGITIKDRSNTQSFIAYNYNLVTISLEAEFILVLVSCSLVLIGGLLNGNSGS